MSICSVLRTASRAVCVVRRCHPRVASLLGHSDLFGTLCDAAAEARGITDGSKRGEDKVGDANIVQVRLGPFQGLAGVE